MFTNTLDVLGKKSFYFHVHFRMAVHVYWAERVFGGVSLRCCSSDYDPILRITVSVSILATFRLLFENVIQMFRIA